MATPIDPSDSSLTPSSHVVAPSVVAVTAKPVLALIRAHVDGDNAKFKEKAVDIARELDMNGAVDLSLWILAQFDMVRTFEVTD